MPSKHKLTLTCIPTAILHSNGYENGAKQIIYLNPTITHYTVTKDHIHSNEYNIIFKLIFGSLVI